MEFVFFTLLRIREKKVLSRVAFMTAQNYCEVKTKIFVLSLRLKNCIDTETIL